MWGLEQPRQTCSQRRCDFRLCFKLTAAFHRGLSGPCFQTGGDTTLLFLTWPVTHSTAAGTPRPPRHPLRGLCAGLAPGPTAPPCHTQEWARRAQPQGGRAMATSRGRGQLGETICPSELPQCFLPRYALFHFEQKPLCSLAGRKIKAVSPPISAVGLWEGAPQGTPSHAWGASRIRSWESLAASLASHCGHQPLVPGERRMRASQRSHCRLGCLCPLTLCPTPRES